MECMGKKAVKVFFLVSLMSLLTTESMGAAAPRPFAPSMVASVKNSQQVYSLVTKNKWFLDFKQSPLYYGVLYDVYPTLFSLPDEFSGGNGTTGKGTTWSGRLVDYMYESVLKNRPVQIHYYQQKRLSSGWGFSVNGMSSAESAVVDKMLKLFKVGDDKDVEISATDKGKVSLIEVKAQKWAVKKEGNCLAIAKDPKVALAIGRNCKPLNISSDLDVEMNLSLLLPSLMVVRDKVIGLSETLKIPFKWNDKENRFDLAPIAVGLSKENIFVSRKLANEFLKVVPSDSHFFAIGNIKIWNGSMTVDNVKSFLASNKRSKDFQKQAAAMLVQVPVKSDGLLATENALILEIAAVNQAQLDQVGEVFESNFGEVFIRPVCGKSLVISRSKEIVQKIQNVCDRKVPSILDRGELNASALTSQDNSLSFFADVGRWISAKIEAGYLSKAKEKKLATTLPEELVKSQKLLEQLPKYLVKGSAKDQNLILK